MLTSKQVRQMFAAEDLARDNQLERELEVARKAAREAVYPVDADRRIPDA